MAEYKKYFEKDPALTRRFQVVQVDEPDEEKAILMMRGIVSPLEKHHQVVILDEAIEAAVRLSHRYIPARQLPDKSVSLLDTASARVAISQHATPPAVEDTRRRISALETERRDHRARRARSASTRGSAAEQDREEPGRGAGHAGRARGALGEGARAGRAVSWRCAKTLREAGMAVDLQPTGDAPDRAAGPGGACWRSCGSLQAELAEHQGENPLILPSVDQQAVASVVADWTGIPVGRMVRNEAQAVLNLAEHAGAAGWSARTTGST